VTRRSAGPLSWTLLDHARAVARQPEVRTSVLGSFSLAATIAGLGAASADGGDTVILGVRLGQAVLAGGVAGAVLDRCAPLGETAPFGRLRTRLMAAALWAGVVAVLWLGLLVGTDRLAADVAPSLPIAGLGAELATLVLAGWGLAVTLSARADWRTAGVGAGLGVIGLVCVSLIWPRTVELLWPSPIDAAAWRSAHFRWAALALVAVAWVLATSRDPAARPLVRARSSRAGTAD